MRKRKISVIGAGNTGAITSLMLATRNLGDIVMLDTPQAEKATLGKAMDILQTVALLKADVTVKGTSRYIDTADSDLVIITAGISRRPGMSRDELLSTNVQIVSQVVEQVVQYSPEAILLVLTNPVDVLTYVAYKISGLPKGRIIGQAGVLDSSRFRTFIAQELNVDVNEVTSYVLGIHGAEMVPLKRLTFVSGIPVSELLSSQVLDSIVQRTRRGGEEIVNLLGNGSACFAPAAALATMAESILLDKKDILPGVAYLEGEYSYYDIVFGVPLVLGEKGIDRIIELNLSPEERKALDLSASLVRNSINNVIESKYINVCQN